ncbi:FHA domain-containing protein [Georgenia sunbinii]|uniref:FHA domain-containing protein n=1 Tax=Georgenia sunbinii TaxID=3117728 RepID=UPI002F2676AE
MTTEPEPQDSASTTARFGAITEGDDAATRLDKSQEDLAAVSGLPPGHALLIVQRGPTAGARFLLDAERTLAGRHPTADIFLDDVTVSRKHAEFIAHEGGYIVRDVGSLNGTYINRERIDSAVLTAGDEVQIGKYRLTYHPSPNQATNGDAAL